jgi:hypothetical protein
MYLRAKSLKDSLHKITPKYETLIMSNKKGPNHPDRAFRFITVKVAQFQNEDRIKISPETVQSPTTATKQTT